MKKKSKTFCHDILNLAVTQAKPLANLVMSLASYVPAKSVVDLSLSDVYHYQYSSIFHSISKLNGKQAYQTVSANIRKLCLSYAPIQKRIRLQTDVTPLIKAYSPSLKNRQFVKDSNTIISGNKPLSIGYPLSCINLSLEDKWSLPLKRTRVSLEQTASECAVEQLKILLPQIQQELDCDLVVNTTDSAYTHAAYLSPLYAYNELVCVSRFRYGTKVYTKSEIKNKKGTPKIYGECYYLSQADSIKKGKVAKTGKSYEKLQTSIYQLPVSEQQNLVVKTAKGKVLKVALYRWNDLKIRTKNGQNMKDKPFDLVGVKVKYKETGKAVFKRDLFICVSGQRKAAVSLQEAYWDYRHRYDIEASFRFNKQNLFLDSYDCEAIEHLDNFLLANQLANWLLYVASDEVNFIPKKWEKQKQIDAQTKTHSRLSIAKTFRATQILFSTFDKTPFTPKTSKKGKGKIKQKRNKYKVIKKGKKKPP